MYREIDWKERELLKSTDSDEETERLLKVQEFIDSYNQLVKLVDGFVKLANRLPNY